jgi:polysaccharide pyruvyl transferase WcaK-like protein
MKILLVGEWNSQNLGDQAIYVSLRRLFEAAGHHVEGWDLSRHTYFEAGSVPPDGAAHVSKRQSGHLQSIGARTKAAIIRVVEVSPKFVRNSVVFITKKRAMLLRHRTWQEEFRKYDWVLFGGGALLMDNNWSFPLSLSHLSRVVKAADRKYACIGCSTGEVYSRQARRWLADFLDGCDYIALRDHLSLEGLRKIGRYEADVFADSALTISDSFESMRSDKSGTLGLNILSPLCHPRLSKQNYERYINEIKAFIRAVGEGKVGAWQRLVLFGTGERRDSAAAIEIAAEFQGRFESVKICAQPRPQGLEELCQTIAGFDVVISTRMHAGVIAKSYGKPLIALVWDRKVRGFCDMVGIGMDCIDIENCRSEVLIARVKQFVESDFIQPDRVEECTTKLAWLPEKVREAFNLEEDNNRDG